ncbi:secretory calcium-binding phosphoprotein proline-glutamine rich 1 [Channa argus]|uniref:secretory calcium-binding phosphoprotein proline-glutamine rich 1 n=1 Tax=Channa argus TaxID=215402 RepID=UPI003522FDF9
MKLLVLVLCFLALSYALPISEEENDRVKRSSSRERGGYYPQMIPQMIPQMFPPYIPPPPPNQDMTALLQLLIARLAALVPAAGK